MDLKSLAKTTGSTTLSRGTGIGRGGSLGKKAPSQNSKETILLKTKETQTTAINLQLFLELERADFSCWPRSAPKRILNPQDNRHKPRISASSGSFLSECCEDCWRLLCPDDELAYN